MLILLKQEMYRFSPFLMVCVEDVYFRIAFCTLYCTYTVLGLC